MYSLIRKHKILEAHMKKKLEKEKNEDMNNIEKSKPIDITRKEKVMP